MIQKTTEQRLTEMREQQKQSPLPENEQIRSRSIGRVRRFNPKPWITDEEPTCLITERDGYRRKVNGKYPSEGRYVVDTTGNDDIIQNISNKLQDIVRTELYKMDLRLANKRAIL